MTDEIHETFPAMKISEGITERLDCTIQHLGINGVDLARTSMSLGPMLRIDTVNEIVLDNRDAFSLPSRECLAAFIASNAGEV